jgi:hypothetical protein
VYALSTVTSYKPPCVWNQVSYGIHVKSMNLNACTAAILLSLKMAGTKCDFGVVNYGLTFFLRLFKLEQFSKRKFWGGGGGGVRGSLIICIGIFFPLPNSSLTRDINYGCIRLQTESKQFPSFDVNKLISCIHESYMENGLSSLTLNIDQRFSYRSYFLLHCETQAATKLNCELWS